MRACHFVFIGEKLPYAYYLAIQSAIKVHNVDRFILWVIEEPQDDPLYDLIKDKVEIGVVEFNFLKGCYSWGSFKSLPCFVGKPESHINVTLKDIQVIRIMQNYGGILLDLDTLSLQDCSGILASTNSIALYDHKAYSPQGTVDNWFNTGVIICQPNTWLSHAMWDSAIQILESGSFKFGDLGPNLLTKIVKENMDKFTIDPNNCIIDGNMQGKVWDWFSDTGIVWPQCRILHTYLHSDYSKQFNITPEFIDQSKSPYATLVKSILSRETWCPLENQKDNIAIVNIVKRPKRFHLLGLPHLPTNKKESLSCAYTQKALKLGTMLKSLGHTVFFYGVEGSDVECDEFIQCLSRNELESFLGKRDDNNKFYNLEHTKAQDIFFDKAILEINKRKLPTDFLLCTYGWGQKPIVDGVGLELSVESGIGYTDTITKYRVFESYTWMNYVYGKDGIDNGPNYDCVIPNYFDPNDFTFSDKKEGWFLYIGRVVWRKGIEIAMQVTERIGAKLKVAGQMCGEPINLNRPHVEYVGYADVNLRKELFAKAKAVFVPTMYIPPFEGVHIEAAFSGTPVITSDWGCFGETVLHGITGYRCRTFDHYIWAAKNVSNITPSKCRDYAIRNYSMDRLKWMYEEYFEMLLDLFTPEQWYTIHNDRTNLNWLNRYEAI